MSTQSAEIAVIGAGVIGLAVALRLAAEGREVVLIDPQEPGSGASFGNAGTLAEYACVPVGTPDVLRALPKLLFDPDSPFTMRSAALPSLAPWLLRFARQSLPAAARANALALSGLLADALPAWREMAAEAQAVDLLRSNGCLYVFRREADFQASAWARSLRETAGARQEVLTAEEVAVLEPGLPDTIERGLYFPESMNVTDPRAMMRRLLDAAISRGAAVRQARISGLAPKSTGVDLVGPGFTMNARKVVVAAGAHSRALAAQAGDKVPLETERGYHLEFPMEAPLLSRPVCPVDLGFYMTPMSGRLRIAGTVELGGLAPPPNPRRLRLLERGARQFFPQLGEPSSRWLGFRPSLPDSRPVIGTARNTSDVVYAFGHGHIGLTLAAVTARVVAAAVTGTGEAPAAFSAGRF